MLTTLALFAVLLIAAAAIMHMADVNSTQMTAFLANPPELVDAAYNGGRVAAFTFDFESDGTDPGDADIVRLGYLPKGFLISHGILRSSVAVATAEIEIGLRDADDLGNADPDALRASAVKNNTVPEVFGEKLTATAARLTERKEVYITMDEAALDDGEYSVTIFGTMET